MRAFCADPEAFVDARLKDEEPAAEPPKSVVAP
jgi:hypothetical protein